MRKVEGREQYIIILRAEATINGEVDVRRVIPTDGSTLSLRNEIERHLSFERMTKRKDFRQ